MIKVQYINYYYFYWDADWLVVESLDSGGKTLVFKS